MDINHFETIKPLCMQNTGEIFMYQTADGKTSISVKLENETVWLSQAQMIELFDRDQSVISRHIRNIFNEKELNQKSNMHFLHIANSDKPVTTYSLDVIISVGYKVKSQRGTQFRIWANKVLKDYLTKGYVIEQKRFEKQSQQLEDLKQTVKLLSNVVSNHELTSEEATGLLKVVTDYTYALDVLDQYDHQVLEIHNTTTAELYIITYHEALLAIKGLRKQTR